LQKQKSTSLNVKVPAHSSTTDQTKPKNQSQVKANSQQALSADDSLNLKIGQMIMIGINDRTSLSKNDPLIQELNNNKIGGIILFEKNISKDSSRVKLKKIIANLQMQSKVPLFIAIDEEGGKVHRLKEKYGFVAMPSAGYLGSLPGIDSTYFYSKRLAEELSELGFNLNFAPVVDLALNPNNPIIAKAGRSYSQDPNTVVANAMTFIKSHHEKNIRTTLKHYPGHGSSLSDTHQGLVDVTAQWQFKELIPYKKIFDSGECDAIVSCHVVNCRLDTNCLPSTLSKIITTEILRDVLGFKGVVFSDDMQMYAISKNYGLEKSIKMAINAGVDVLVFGNNVNLSDRITATEIHATIKKLVKSKEISESRIDESFLRIRALKNKE
jgi:beta-N-acetylhexosaminidase